MKNFAFVSGDARTLYGISYASSLGIECAAFGISKNLPNEAVKMTCLEDCFEFADAVILPVPVTRDQKTVTGCDKVSLAEILRLGEKYKYQTKIFGGMPPKECLGLIEDFCKGEGYLESSSRLTANGFFEYLQGENGCILEDEKACVCGYGRIGKMLCAKLRKLNIDTNVLTSTVTDVTVMDQMTFYPYSMAKDALLGVTRLINTAPCNVIDDSTVRSAEENLLYYELASAPFGISAKAKEYLGKRHIYLPGLPGKYFPYQSGKLIVDGVLDAINKNLT